MLSVTLAPSIAGEACHRLFPRCKEGLMKRYLKSDKPNPFRRSVESSQLYESHTITTKSPARQNGFASQTKPISCAADALVCPIFGTFSIVVSSGVETHSAPRSIFAKRTGSDTCFRGRQTSCLPLPRRDRGTSFGFVRNLLHRWREAY
jgi:hypothetical protein